MFRDANGRKRGAVRCCIGGEMDLVESCHCEYRRRDARAPAMAWAAIGQSGFEAIRAVA